MCSDGLNGEISDPMMVDIVQRYHQDLQVVCHELIEAGNRAGGHDNITVLLVRQP